MDFKVTILLCISYFSFVKCIIPNLSVRKIDSKVIERKRQDTLEICRIFNEEKNRIISNNTNIEPDKYNKKNRIKRDVDNNEIDNSVLKKEDLVRVENIVDKLYDDLDPRGNPVEYRRRNLKELNKGKDLSNKKNRRFNFAPAQLMGPLSKEEVEVLKPLQTKSVRVPWIKKWKHGVVPFFIDSNTYDSFLAETILKAFDYIEKATCIRLQRLRERPTDKKSMENVAWLYITNPSGIRQCVHTNERRPNNGVQMVVFGYDCLSQGEIAHEVMHILGFSHEHTRSDRDRYISILWDNIKPGYKKYFDVRKEDYLSTLPYDYASVLHYPPRAFSKNGQVTVMTETGTKIGQRDAFSELDVEKIRMIYGLECVERNKDYLNKTCATAVKRDYLEDQQVPEEDIKKYFQDRLWPYGIINYKIKDALEFTAEERENIKAVISHIEKETCIEFRDTTEEDEESKEDINKDIAEPSNSPEIESTTNNLTSVDNSDPDVKDQDDLYSINENKIYNSTYRNATFAPDVTVIRSGKIVKQNKKGHFELKKDKPNKENIHKENKKIRIPLPLSSRRHSSNVYVLKRSTSPGCQCPPPGRPNGAKVLTINADCFNSVNDLLHLFVHVLGLDHQHNMHDRDTYLYIMWDNIEPELKSEISKILPPGASAGFPYDYQSVMHYPWLQIKDGLTNIMYPVWNDGWGMGHWQGLSWTDVQKIEYIYKEQCEKREKDMGK